MLLHVNSTNFSRKSLLTLLSAFVQKIRIERERERELKPKTHLVHPNFQDVGEFSISKANVLVRS